VAWAGKRQAGAMKDILVGVRHEASAAAPNPVRAARSLAFQGQVAYSVKHQDIQPPARPSENRANRRTRTRLRSAKLLNGEHQFLCECRVHDRSASGARIVLTRETGLPNRFFLYDDETNEILVATVAWRRGLTLGVRFSAPKAPPLKPSLRFALLHRYYAVTD
jgi:hypothetical protein